jgi:uncharacterized membrane protein
MEDNMEQVLLVVSVAAMFIIRIGIPVILLLSVGILIDRWQSKREKEVQQEMTKKA